ncbi:Mut7-C RNAse domain-containing protein [Candidatus Micrarchaeota archaeon]|nr:Mut7-C RNAse domain-containing protein [Candidatus Micrarchaeota archaeon]
MHYVTDVMLARLSRWLRLFGVSVSVPDSTDDDALIKQCIREKASLITKDRGLAQRATDYVPCTLIRSNDIEKQLLEFSRASGFSFKRLKERDIPSPRICSMCNGVLKQASKQRVRGRVPFKSWKNATCFFKCSCCRRIYWNGSHTAHILRLWKKLKTRSGGSVRSPCIETGPGPLLH